MKTVQRYAVIITAILFACTILFLGCSNNAGGGKPPVSQSGGGSSNPPAGQNITLTVGKGEHVQSVTPPTLSVAKGTAWSAVKGNFTVTYDSGWEAAGWKLESAGGADIRDETVFNENKTIYALSKPTPPGETVRLTIRGDERIDEAASGFIDIGKDKTWAEIKGTVTAKAVLKTEWSTGDYGVYEWHLTDENGTLITDTTVFTADTVVCAVTNYTKFKMEGAVIKGYTGKKPQGKIILPAKNGETPITAIAYSAFFNCSGLTGDLNLSGCTRLTEIGPCAFQRCSGLTGTLTLPANLTTLGESAFSGCSGLTGTLTLPANLTRIGQYAFQNCRSLTGDLNLSACTQLTSIAASTFSGCTGLTGTVSLPAKLERVGESAFENCTKITALDFSACTQSFSISARAFMGCTDLSGTVSFPAKLKTIEGAVFFSCEKVNCFDFSQCTQLASMGSSAFANCTAARYKVKTDSGVKETLIIVGVDENKIDMVP